MPVSSLSLKGRALRYLSQREHTRSELERKLRRGADGEEVPQAALSALMDELAERGFQSDQRTAEALVTAKSARWGRRRLQQQMQRLGVTEQLAAEAMAPLAQSELERARALWQRRFGEVAATPQERARQMRFLAGRGFDGEVIQRVVRGADAED
jgi:regulatory protein